MDEDDMNTDEENMNTDEGIRISNYLWYMLVSGYVLPVAGFFTFFIVTYYWVQEFPIGLCIDLLSLLQMPGMDNVLNYKESSKELSNKMDKIMGYLHYSDLKTKFNGLHQKRWLDDKFLYPFKSPVIVILCMSYTTLQLAFVICAAVVETDSGDLKIQPLNGGPWVGIYVVAVFHRQYCKYVCIYCGLFLDRCHHFYTDSNSNDYSAHRIDLFNLLSCIFK